MVLAAIFAEFITPYGPEDTSFEFMLTALNWAHPAGPTNLVIFSRASSSVARTALAIGFTCAIIGAALGLVIGIASAYFGGLFDLIVQRASMSFWPSR